MLMALATRAAALVGILATALLATVGQASAHRDPCHPRYECPSDHHTYAWGPKRLYCTSYRDERQKRDTITVRYDGRTYWCHRR